MIKVPKEITMNSEKISVFQIIYDFINRRESHERISSEEGVKLAPKAKIEEIKLVDNFSRDWGLDSLDMLELDMNLIGYLTESFMDFYERSGKNFNDLKVEDVLALA